MACGSRATLATKLVPRSSICLLCVGLARQQGCSIERGVNDRGVAGASAEMAAQQVADFALAGPRPLTQKMIERHQNARGAEAALQCMVTSEGRLQDAEAIRRRRQTLDGPHLAAVDLDRKRQAGTGQHSVYCHGACAADAMFASDMRAGGADAVAQEVRQQHPRLGFALCRDAVQRKSDDVALV